MYYKPFLEDLTLPLNSEHCGQTVLDLFSLRHSADTLAKIQFRSCYELELMSTTLVSVCK